jgi:hypothetical protein
MFSSEFKNNTKISALTHQFNITLVILGREIRKRKKKKCGRLLVSGLAYKKLTSHCSIQISEKLNKLKNQQFFLDPSEK